MTFGFLVLSPTGLDTGEGLRARVADPVWFLTRQWQLGELQGEDVSTPVIVNAAPRHVPITFDPKLPKLDPSVIPAEALVEAEPDDWWTMGRRLRLGRAAAKLSTKARRAAYRFGPLASPYGALSGAVDGREVYRAGILGGKSVWAEVPKPVADHWSSFELNYSAGFTAGKTVLDIRAHEGGDVDWYSVSGTPGALLPPARAKQIIPSRLSYPGAPNPRWWQLENSAVDIGGYSPDRSHFPTALLMDLALEHSDDWFTFPVAPPQNAVTSPSSGVLVTLDGVTVLDSFGETWELATPSATGPGAWSLFHTTGLPESQLLIWPVAVAPQTGPVLDEVLIGVDEDANLAWAVELRADGIQLLTDADSSAALVETTRTFSRDFAYLPSTTLPDAWHPYERVRIGDPLPDGPGFVTALTNPLASDDGRSGEWRQGVLADLNGPVPVFRHGPRSTLIGGPSNHSTAAAVDLGRGHDLAADAIPSNGVLLRRRALLARDTNGRPVLWVERSARPVAGPPTSHLRFDVFEEKAPIQP